MDQNTAPQNQPESPAPAPVQPAAAPVQGGGNGFAIAALVLGIIAFLFGWAGLFNLVTAVLAVVFGILALNKHQSKGMAVAGLVLGGIGLLTSIVVAMVGAAFISNLQDTAKENSNSNSSSQTAEPESDKWDVQAAYDKITTGMTKAEVEEATGKKSESCSSVESEVLGKSETCSYGNSFTDGGSISVTYDNDGKVSTKYKYES